MYRKKRQRLNAKNRKSIATVVLMSFQRARNNAVCLLLLFGLEKSYKNKRKQTTFGFKVKKSK